MQRNNDREEKIWMRHKKICSSIVITSLRWVFIIMLHERCSLFFFCKDILGDQASLFNDVLVLSAHWQEWIWSVILMFGGPFLMVPLFWTYYGKEHQHFCALCCNNCSSFSSYVFQCESIDFNPKIQLPNEAHLLLAVKQSYWNYYGCNCSLSSILWNLFLKFTYKLTAY